MFKPLQVIRHIGLCTDTGIIVGSEGHRYRIMFETAHSGVEFRWYSVTGLKDYRVIG